MTADTWRPIPPSPNAFLRNDLPGIATEDGMILFFGGAENVIEASRYRSGTDAWETFSIHAPNFEFISHAFVAGEDLWIVGHTWQQGVRHLVYKRNLRTGEEQLSKDACRELDDRVSLTEWNFQYFPENAVWTGSSIVTWGVFGSWTYHP